MASVTLTTGWLHLAASPSTYVTLDAQAVDEVASRPVEVERYAAGRIRSVVRPGVGSGIKVAAAYVSRATADTLRTWVGETLMWRDPMGRKVFGVFDQLDIKETVGLHTKPSVSFQLIETTWDEEV